MHDQPPRVVTPEAVALEVTHAGPGTRIAARGLDLLIQGAGLATVGIFLGVAALGGGGSAALAVVALVLAFLVVFGYPAIMEATWHGRTFGKAAFGLRVVTSHGAPITFRHAAVRSALFVVDGLLVGPAVGIISLLVTRDTVRLGDLAAGTIVLRERGGGEAPVYFHVPSGWESFVAHLDVTGLGPDAYGVVRSYLLRCQSLPAAQRSRLAPLIASRTASRLRLAPQPMPAEWFLWCVAAAVQQRSGTAWAQRA